MRSYHDRRSGSRSSSNRYSHSTSSSTYNGGARHSATHEYDAGIRGSSCSNESFFARFCKEGATRRVESPRDASAFLKSVIESSDKGDTLTKLSIPCELSFGLKKNMALKLGTVVFDCPGFLDALLDAVNKDLCDANSLRHIALFVTNVLSHENSTNCGVSNEVANTRKDSAKWLLKALQDNGDEIVQLMLKNNMLVDSSELLATYEPKHDNDKPFNYQDIQLLPTVDELKSVLAHQHDLCSYRGWLGDQDALHAQLLDKQFRLLRDDFVAPLAMEVKECFDGKSRRLRYLNPLVVDICTEEKSSRGPCINVKFQLPPPILSRFEAMKTNEIETFLEEEGSRILGRDSVVLFFNDKREISFIGIVSLRNCSSMTKELVSVRSQNKEEENTKMENSKEEQNKKDTKRKSEKGSGPVSPAVTVGIWFHEETMVKLLARAAFQRPFAHFAVVAKSSFFSYEPILSRLQDMSEVMFEKEIVLQDFRSVNEVEEHSLPLNIAAKLQSDPSQRKAATVALNQRITLIQGPPGTGKTYVGVQLVQALLKLNPRLRIMCLCYTNHALDSFLESLIQDGIRSSTICRLGSVTKISASLQQCSLQSSEISKFNKSQFQLHRSYQDEEAEYINSISRLSQDLKFGFSAGSWPHVKYAMRDVDSELFDINLLKQFEVENDAPDGMRVVGRNNKAIDEKSGWKAWMEGQPRPSWIKHSSSPVRDLWSLSRDQRRHLAAEWSALAREMKAAKLIDLFREYSSTKRNHDSLRENCKIEALQRRSIVAATTTFAAKNRNLLDSFEADVLIVEEAAEILEAHILTNLSPSMKQVIMIGDHLQLRPKVEHYPLRVESGRGIDFDRSLFERLILARYPYCTLSVQHRMRPEISSFIKGTYPLLQDHASTQGRDHIKGVSGDVVFIDHRELEQTEGDEDTMLIETNSKVNAFEVKMIMKMLNYLIQQGYKGSDIVVLTPYLGQMMALRQELKKHSAVFKVMMSDLDKEQLAAANNDDGLEDDEKVDAGNNKASEVDAKQQSIRIATVDNFQGEEAKIIIASLVRSNEQRDIGFVSGAERVNVLFSRARDGFFLLGNSETFSNARSGRGRELWTTLIDQLKRKGCVYNGFPVKCTVHGVEQIISTPEEFDTKCPEGGCSQPCQVVLPTCPLKHPCQLKCHPNLSHTDMKCMMRILDKCPRGLHSSERICSSSYVPCNAKHRFSCSVGHSCYGPCHRQQITVCSRCKELQDIKRKEEERLQAEIDHAAKETEELEHMHQLQIAKLEAKLRLDEERAKQRAIKENIIAAGKGRIPEEKEAASSDAHYHSDLSVAASNKDSAEDTIEIDLSQELSFLHEEPAPTTNVSMKSDPRISANSSNNYNKRATLSSKPSFVGESKQTVSPQVEATKRPLGSSQKKGSDAYGDSQLHVTETGDNKVQSASSMSSVAKELTESVQQEEIGISSRGKVSPAVTAKLQTNVPLKHQKAVVDKDADFEFTLCLIELITSDQFAQVITSVKNRYQDKTRPLHDNSMHVDHRVLFLLAQMLLGLDPSQALGVIQTIHDEMSSRVAVAPDSQILYKYVGAMVYEKNGMTYKAQELAKSFLNDIEMRDKSSFEIPKSWIKQYQEFLNSYKDGGITNNKAELTTAAANSIDHKWNKVVAQQPTKKSPSVAMDALLQMSSLDTIKAKFLELYDSITLATKQGRDLTSSNFNCLFYGNPGTGKTTVAQLFAQFLIDLQLLPSECEILKKTGSELINGGVKELKDALDEMKEDANGGVIFVDEAYQLDTPEGHRILDFILGQSERFQGEYGKLVWIFAGYTKNMEKLLEHNVGLPSRFPNKFMFEDYDDKELLSIFQGLMQRRGRDATCSVKGLQVKFKTAGSSKKKQKQQAEEEAQKKKAQMPQSVQMSYSQGYMSKPDEQDEWGNVWQWDTASFTFRDAYGNTTGYGKKGLGAHNNPLIGADGTPWCFNHSQRVWYDRNNASITSKDYPGKPVVKSVQQIRPQEQLQPIDNSPFYATDEKWMRIAITRLGRLRGVTGFGNARAVRNLFDVCCKRQTNRIAELHRQGYSSVDIKQFTRDDFLGPKASFEALRDNCEAFQALLKMEGLKEVKQSVELIIRLVVTNTQREEQEKPLLEVALNRIFLGNPGTGKTTVAKLYGEILKHLGLLSKGEVIYKTGSDFIGSALGKSEEITRGILEQAQGCVLVIDEAYGLYQGVGSDGGNEPYREAVINTLVEQIQGKPGEDRVVLLLGYKEEMERMLSKCNPGLARRFQLENAFQFADYDDSTLLTILKKSVKRDELFISEETAAFAIKQLAKAKARPHFGNAGAVNNLLSDAKLRMQSRLHSSASASSSSMLKKEDFVPEGYTEELISEDELLSQLVGNQFIKNKLKQYRNTVELKRRKNQDVKSVLPFTYLFTGSPGTGKTTVARLMGKMFFSLGIIPTDEVIEKSASDFITGYVGQAGKTTRDIFQQALGRVLFIDEAYQLNPQVGGGYMSEVVDEMVKLLTSKEYEQKLVIILAGYERDIKEMLKVNQGLRSRFPETIRFEDFDEPTIFEMLCQGVEKIASESIVAMELMNEHENVSGFEEVFPEGCRNYLGRIASELKTLPNFANGRDIKTFLKKLEMGLANQCAESGSDAITMEALMNAMKELQTEREECDDSSGVPSIAQQRSAGKMNNANLAFASQTSRIPPPPPPAIRTTAATVAEKAEEMVEDTSTTTGVDDRRLFLSHLQSELDRQGLNSAEGVAELSSLPPDHPKIVKLANDIATACGIDIAIIKELLKNWSNDQAKVREQLRQQEKEEELAKAQNREAMVPIWRCGVCGRADQPYIACYVQPYIVRYEKRHFK